MYPGSSPLGGTGGQMFQQPQAQAPAQNGRDNQQRGGYGSYGSGSSNNNRSASTNAPTGDVSYNGGGPSQSQVQPGNYWGR